MNIEEVREMARQHQINPEGLSHMDLIRSIQGKEGNVNCYATSYVVDCGQNECIWSPVQYRNQSLFLTQT